MDTDSLLHVDLAAIGRNARLMVELAAPRATCCGIVKADAYGLGARRVAKALIDAGMNRLAVFRVEEALDLLEMRSAVPILLLAPVRSLSPIHPLASAVQRGHVELVLHDHRILEDLAALAKLGSGPISVHVEVDTGMCRGGMKPSSACDLVDKILRTPFLRLAGIMTHFTGAGWDAETTREQHKRFQRVIDAIGPVPDSCLIHAAATAATVRDSAYHWDCVRIGLGWCGCVPGHEDLATRMEHRLTPAISWRSSVCHVHEVTAGTPVGYGGVWTAPQDTVIGIVPVGYADGIPPTAGATNEHGGASLRVGPGQRGAASSSHRVNAQIVGAVSMDQVAIDLGTPSGCRESFVGRAVEIIAATDIGPNSLRGFAEACGVSPHQLLVGIGPRVPRVAVNRPQVAQTSSEWQAAAI